MELAFVIWMISTLDSIENYFGIITAVTTIGFIFAGIGRVIFSDGVSEDAKPIFRKFIKWTGILALVCGFLCVIIPSTKTGWMMAGGYVAQTAIQSDTAKKFAMVIENKMQEVLDEATNQAKIKAKSINKETDKTEKD
jgi:hypothetical protein